MLVRELIKLLLDDKIDLDSKVFLRQTGEVGLGHPSGVNNESRSTYVDRHDCFTLIEIDEVE